MKKVTSLLVTLALVFFFTTSALSYDFVLNDGIGATYSGTYMLDYQGQKVYAVDVAPQGHGIMIYNTTKGCFTIKVFHDDYWYSYSQEGYWKGCGSTAYNANCAGGLFSVTISCGAASATPEECANSNLKE